MGKTTVVAETGAGQHGVALATACALVGIDCEIHMGQVDTLKESPNVVKMKILACKLVPVITRGTKTLKDALKNTSMTPTAISMPLDASLVCNPFLAWYETVSRSLDGKRVNSFWRKKASFPTPFWPVSVVAATRLIFLQLFWKMNRCSSLVSNRLGCIRPCSGIELGYKGYIAWNVLLYSSRRSR